MDALKQQLLRIQQQLARLSASQKMLTASLVVIMVMTLFYWSRFASVAEMDVLLDQPMSAEEISQIKTALSSKGIKYQVQGDRILVSADQKFEALADLGYSQLLPRDMKSGFDEVVQKMTVWDSNTRTEQFFNHAKERTLSMMISRWPGVKSATVLIDGTRKVSPIKSLAPTATIDIVLKGGESPTKRMGEAVVNLVAGAQSGLDRGGIKVTMNGQAYKASDPNSPFDGGDNPILEAKAHYEKYYVEKILNLTNIANVYATVSVELDTSTKVVRATTVDPKNQTSIAKRETTSTDENTQPTAGGEPGVASNTGLDLQNSAAAGGSRSNSEKADTEFEVKIGDRIETTQTPAGSATAVAAALRVPESYFRKIWKMRNAASTAEPTEAEIETLVQREIPRLRDAVKMATNIKDDTAVSVATYVDVDAPMITAEIAGGGLASLPMGVGFGAKEIAIGVLAVVSLFMVSMMVRKSAPQPTVAMAGPTDFIDPGPRPPSDVTVSADIAGEVGAAGMMLTGHEMSEDQIESQQVIEQVGTMIKDNPEVAANLVKRWLNRQ